MQCNYTLLPQMLQRVVKLLVTSPIHAVILSIKGANLHPWVKIKIQSVQSVVINCRCLGEACPNFDHMSTDIQYDLTYTLGKSILLSLHACCEHVVGIKIRHPVSEVDIPSCAVGYSVCLWSFVDTSQECPLMKNNPLKKPLDWSSI